MKNSDHVQSQLFKIDTNEPSSIKSKFNAESSMDVDNPYLMGIYLNKTRPVNERAGLPSADKFDLSQKRTRIFLKDLLMSSSSYYCGASDSNFLSPSIETQ